jgi:nucleotide-binding universal stress UspA family protein
MSATFTPYLEDTARRVPGDGKAYIRVRLADGPRRDGYIVVYLPDGTALAVRAAHLLRLEAGQRRSTPRDADLQSILVATDGSHSAMDAVAFAVDLACERGALLHIVHVVRALDVLSDGDEEVFALPHAPSEQDHAVLAQAATLAEAAGVEATTALRIGSTVDEIVAYGDACAVDVIVVGSRGHGALARWLVRSVSLGVGRKSKRRVLVVRAGATDREALHVGGSRA